MKSILIGVSMFFLLVSVSLAQESPLTITNMKVEPAIVNPGGKVLVSCRVSHSGGPMFIERVAAIAFHGEWVTGYTMLYDDGTNGDIAPDDGLYSLDIKAPDTAGEAKIVFSAVDTGRSEIESEPIILTVK